MTKTEFNSMLRTLARKLVNGNFSKSSVGRIMFGGSNYPRFLEFIKLNNTNKGEFGLSPLGKAVQNTNKQLMLVVVDPEDEKFIENIREKNIQFSIELEKQIKLIIDAERKNKQTKKIKRNNEVLEKVFKHL